MILFLLCGFVAFLLLCFHAGWKAGARPSRPDEPSWDGHSGHGRKGTVADWGP